jgi:hypothetical protein
MALAVKGSRLIIVDGTVYRWRLRRTPSYNQECLVAAVIQMALGRGWQPAAPGVPFRLSVASGDLPAEVKTEMIPGDPWMRL